MPPVGFEPTISADERPETYASDRAAIGTGTSFRLLDINIYYELKINVISDVK